ncbi:MAG TPA: hypothetical protein ENJ32_12095 [Crenotrichaceae bacterium]|nr:hypothetical protein [Crenotrichaceae bacterium]
MVSTLPRKILLHAHIFKNAGTSVDNILRHNYQNQFIDHRDSDALAAGKQPFLEEFLRSHPHILAFASHHLPLPLQSTPEFEFYIIMMLRHPVIRASSAYRFERNQRVDNASANAAKRYNFADYVQWHLDLGSKMFFNYFIRYCTSTVTEALTDQLCLEYALAQSEHFSVLGVVEQFDRSMSALQRKLTRHHINLSLIPSKKNVTDQSTGTLEDKLKRIESELGENLYEILFDQNKQDLQFYEHAVQRLNCEENQE